MKKTSFAVAAALVLALALTGCSAGRENNSSAPMEPSHTVSGSDSGTQNSAGIGGTADGNDAMQGGGAGGTNDLNNDGTPDNSAGVGDQSRSRSGVGQAADDIGRAAGDLTRGAGNVVRDAGDAIGNAANDVGRAMR